MWSAWQGRTSIASAAKSWNAGRRSKAKARLTRRSSPKPAGSPQLSFPAILKAYIETVSVPGITFRYGEGDTGCIGCCKASRLLYLTTRGGLYTGAASGLELGEKEMKALSQFFGIPGFDCLFAEGTDLLPPEEVAERMEQAKSAAAQMARVW